MNKLTKGLTSLAVSLTVLAGGFLSPFTPEVHAAEMDVKVQVKHNLVLFPDAQPFLDDNHSTQVPLRFVTEKLGYEVDWQKVGDQIKVILTNDKHTITLVSGKKEASIDNETITLNTAPRFQDGRVYVPLRFLSTTAGLDVRWDADSKLAILSEDGAHYAPDYQVFESTAYTADPSENGGYGALDYMGNPLALGTVAVDPSVIPLGSKLYIEGYSFDGLPEGGMFVYATDAGSSIKGNRMDIYVPVSKQTAWKYGIQKIKVYRIS